VNLITDPVQAVMAKLEARQLAEYAAGTRSSGRLYAIPPEVGRLLLTLAIAVNARTIVELGTSGGYSTLWLATAARQTGGRVTTFETDPEKITLARGNFLAAGVDALIECRAGDGAAGVAQFHGNADLVFIDCAKDVYLRALDPAIEALRKGGFLVADNLLSHAEDLMEFRAEALSDPRLSGLVIPIGQGELVAVRL
jgi:predicted O-methyltransferase YrrM